MALERVSGVAARAATAIGVLGGTFDPIHNGHLVIAEEARVRLQLDRVLFVPAQASPFKQNQHTTPATHRCRMIELAIAGNPTFALSRVDLQRPAPSYTVDTLRLLKQEWGEGSQLYFIMGQDAIAGLLAWRDPAEIIRLARLVLMRRPGHAPDIQHLEAQLPGLRESLIILDSPELSVSSTELRRRVAMGWPIRYQVPDSVMHYIMAHQLYRDYDSASLTADQHA